MHEGLLEYELVDLAESSAESSGGFSARALALTLLRCTGAISRGPMATRPMPAGPSTPVEGPQMIGPQRFRYALQTGEADPYALVDDAFLPLRIADPVKIRGMADAPDASSDDQGHALEVRGAEVSSVRRVAGRLEVRVWNPSDRDAVVEIAGRSGWSVDLRGAPVEPFEGRVPLGPWRIATLALTDRD